MYDHIILDRSKADILSEFFSNTPIPRFSTSTFENWLLALEESNEHKIFMNSPTRTKDISSLILCITEYKSGETYYYFSLNELNDERRSINFDGEMWYTFCEKNESNGLNYLIYADIENFKEGKVLRQQFSEVSETSLMITPEDIKPFIK
jgi:hypothetical protein